MKTFQIKFKILICLLLLVVVVGSCRDGNKTATTNSDSDSNLEQVTNRAITDNADDATNRNASQANKASNTIDANGETSPDSPKNTTAPITLDCNYFTQNPNTVLKNNPESPVDYIITCMTKIDGKLTIAAGVVIAFEQDAGMEFNAKSSFRMEGTAEKPILLTGKEKTKGFWRGVQTESANANNIMSYVTIDYAGGNSRGSAKAALSIYRESSNLNLDHCTFSNSKNNGMLVSDKTGKDVHNIVMTNCTFTKNNIPLQTNITRLRIFNGTNSFSGNDKDYIYLDGGSLYGDATWAKLDVPYFFQGNFKYQEGVLTVQPGTEVIMPAQSWLHISDKASLLMIGNADDPIIIRGEHDVAGFWQQLNIDSSSPLNEIGHVIFKNAGRTTSKPNGAVFLPRSRFLNIHDVVFSKCFEYGLSIQQASKSHLEHANLKLDNTPKLFSDYSGKELADPNQT